MREGGRRGERKGEGETEGGRETGREMERKRLREGDGRERERLGGRERERLCLIERKRERVHWCPSPALQTNSMFSVSSSGPLESAGESQR